MRLKLEATPRRLSKRAQFFSDASPPWVAASPTRRMSAADQMITITSCVSRQAVPHPLRPGCGIVCRCVFVQGSCDGHPA